MSDAIIANRYAAALFETVGGGQDADRVRTELTAFSEALANEDLGHLVANPRVSDADKVAVLTGVGELLSASDHTMNLVRLLVSNGRMGMVAGIGKAFGQLVDRANGRLNVTVTSAVALSDDTRSQVDTRLTDALGGKADIQHQVNTDLLGGLVIQVGSKVFDNSIRHHLAQLRQAL